MRVIPNTYSEPNISLSTPHENSELSVNKKYLMAPYHQESFAENFIETFRKLSKVTAHTCSDEETKTHCKGQQG